MRWKRTMIGIAGIAVVTASFFILGHFPLPKHLMLWSDACLDQKSAACKDIKVIDGKTVKTTKVKDEEKGTGGTVLEDGGAAKGTPPAGRFRRKRPTHHAVSVGSAISLHTRHSNPRHIRPHPKKAKSIQGDTEETGAP